MSVSVIAPKKTTQAKANPWTTHPRVRHFIQHAVNRVARLLDLYDRRIKQLTESIDREAEISLEAEIKADKTLLSLTRMVRHLHQDLQQHTAMLYPTRSEQAEQHQSHSMQPSLPDFPELKNAGTSQRFASNSLDVEPPAIEASGTEEFRSILEQARETVNQFATALHSSSIPVSSHEVDNTPSLAMPSQPEATYACLLSKKQKKQQKFSHSFFHPAIR